MPQDTEFDFTDDELHEAFRLVLSAEDARRDTEAVRAALNQGGKDWATSEELLLLLALATPTGRVKVDRIRRAGQAERIAVDLERAPPSGNDATIPFADRLRDAISAEEREWEKNARFAASGGQAPSG